MTDRKTKEVTEFRITDVSGNELMIGKKYLLGTQATRANLLTFKLEGGGELPDALKNQHFTNMKSCREFMVSYYLKKDQPSTEQTPSQARRAERLAKG